MKAKWAGVIGLAILASGCATIPSGPSVLVLPGTGKSLNDFRASDFQCRQYATQQIEGLGRDPSVRNAAIGTAVGAVAGAAIGGQQGAGIGAGAGLLVGSASGADAGRSFGYDAQTRYDNAYIQCMYAGGHRVPVPASIARSLMEQSSATTASSAAIPPPPPHAPPASPPPDYVPPPAKK